MFTIEQSQYLLELPKKVQLNGILQDSLTITQDFPFQEKYILISPVDTEFTFLYEIYQSKKNQFKLSLYLMEEDSRVGLLRVDFSGQHENPQTITDNLPAVFHPFAGKFFNFNEHHIHYFVEGYKTTLDWALPLTDDTFPVKQINDSNDVVTAFKSFNNVIHLETNFIIHPLLI
jgi:hypothetical protein